MLPVAIGPHSQDGFASGELHEECAEGGRGPGVSNNWLEFDPSVESGGAGGHPGSIHAGANEANLSDH